MSTHSEHRVPLSDPPPDRQRGPAGPVALPLTSAALTSAAHAAHAAHASKERAAGDGGPPRRSKVAAWLAVLACAACCALPVLIGAGLLTGAGAALAERTLLAVAWLLLAAAAGMWWLHRRRNRPSRVVRGGYVRSVGMRLRRLLTSCGRRAGFPALSPRPVSPPCLPALSAPDAPRTGPRVRPGSAAGRTTPAAVAG
ncbi:hypothetical protein ACFOWE_26800 [Planomonospora corallina]|uniref:Uncharacterized protein n=1 Tax=Planomonospora corallina TaxID=1806052 RepID=A0ABV8ICZ1_9ACTN